MTDKSNTLQVVSRDLLERLHGWLTHIHHFRVTDMADLEAALKQSPALDGEPEVLAWVHPHRGLDWRVERTRVAPKTELIDRASIAPYKAAIKRLIEKANADDQAVEGLASMMDKLQARVTDLEELLQVFIENSDDRDVVELSENALRPTERAQS